MESELGCLRVRGSQRPCRLFKHRGHFKRSSLTTAQSPPGISEEMIALLPATVQWGLLEHRRRTDDICTQRGVRECEFNNTLDTFVFFINTMTSTYLRYSCSNCSLIHFLLNVLSSFPVLCSFCRRHINSA